MKNRKLRDSFGYAFTGIKQAFKTESNVRIHTLAGTLAILFGVLLRLSRIEWLFIIVAITIVLVSELLNTSVENAIDMVCGNTYSEIAKYAKDIAAGATLIGAIGAALIGVIIFAPKILQLFI